MALASTCRGHFARWASAISNRSLFFYDFGPSYPTSMAKTLRDHAYRKKVDRELFDARQKLHHLVQIYQNGQWRQYYKEDTFVTVLRQARQAVDHWTNEHG